VETRENTLSERERYLLRVLVNDPDEVARRRAYALLAWAEGKAPKTIAHELNVRPAQVHKLTRSFLQSRLEVFPPASVERALRGAAGSVSVNELLAQYPSDIAHAKYVASLALQIFDSTSDVHQVSAEWRHVLEAGARLHNLGGHGDEDANHYLSSHDEILAHDLDGFSAKQRDVIACLTLFYRKKAKPEKDGLFVTFDDELKRITLALAAILRVADALDFTHTQTTVITGITHGEVIELGIAGKDAAKNAARANKKADLWRQVLAPPLVVRANGKEVAAQPAPVKLALAADETVAQAARVILAVQFEKLRSFEGAVRDEDDIDAIHDMRVASRRMASAVRLFRKYLPAKKVKKLRPTLEEVRDLLGAVRNLDVLRANLEDYCKGVSAGESAGLDAVSNAWRDARDAKQRELVKLLDSVDYEDWVARMDAFLKEKDKGDAPRVSDVVPALIWKQYGTVRAYDARLKITSLEELHALRIDIKRLRYTLEFFREVLFPKQDSGEANGSKASAVIEPLVALQDHLGTLQDAVVAGQALTDFITEQAQEAKKRGEIAGEFQAVAMYHAHLQERIRALREELPAHWEIILLPQYREDLARATAAL